MEANPEAAVSAAQPEETGYYYTGEGVNGNVAAPALDHLAPYRGPLSFTLRRISGGDAATWSEGS